MEMEWSVNYSHPTPCPNFDAGGDNGSNSGSSRMGYQVTMTAVNFEEGQGMSYDDGQGMRRQSAGGERKWTT